ncbi:MAG: hypothetical protein COB22_08075 [Cycloclasticus sp.]|nr:MAG: hypothetical protein COB22_08075 [Cycloclasticus sp.]
MCFMTDNTEGTTFFLGSKNVKLLKEIEDFRVRIWSEKVGLDTAKNRFSLDAADLRTYYCVKYDKNKMIGVGGLTIGNNANELKDFCSYSPYLGDMHYPLAILSRRVVDKHYRNKNIGKELVLARIQKAQQLKMKQVWGEILEEYNVLLVENGFQDQGQSADKSIPGDWRIMLKDMANS